MRQDKDKSNDIFIGSAHLEFDDGFAVVVCDCGQKIVEVPLMFGSALVRFEVGGVPDDDTVKREVA